METRRLGGVGHESSVVTFGAIAAAYLTQEGANQLVEFVLDRGVNHFDVAPTYGDAELKIGPKLREHRDEVFLGCKTKERSAEGARRELERSLTRMGVDSIDLYQFHAVTETEEIDEIVAPDGALAAVREARDDGLVDHVGLTSHGEPTVILEAIDRIPDLETVMHPMNFTAVGTGHDYAAVRERLADEDMGALGIKAFAKRPWPPEDELPPENRPYATWYEPYDTQAEIDDCLAYALSAGMDTITNAGDPKLVPMIVDAADRFEALSADERAALETGAGTGESPVPRT